MKHNSIFVGVIGTCIEVVQKSDDFLFPFVETHFFDCFCEKMMTDYDLIICDCKKDVPRNISFTNRMKCIVCINDNVVLFDLENTYRYNMCWEKLYQNLINQIDNQPFISSVNLMNELILDTNVSHIDEENSEYVAKRNMEEKTAFVLLGKDPSVAKNILNFARQNVIAYYDLKREYFVDRSGQECSIDFDYISVINTLNSPANKQGIEHRFPHLKKKYLGEFGDFENYAQIYFESTPDIFLSPTVIISSFGPEMGKFDILCDLCKQFEDINIPVVGVSSNPCASIMSNIEYSEYPKLETFPIIVDNIRKKMKELDLKNNELVLWDIPGGCTQIDNLKTDYGALTYAYLNAIKNIDVAILCFNNQISEELIKRQCYIFESHGVSKIILVHSDTVYLRTMIAEGKLSVFKDNDLKKVEINNYPIFYMNDIREGKLKNYLINLFTGVEEI